MLADLNASANNSPHKLRQIIAPHKKKTLKKIRKKGRKRTVSTTSDIAKAVLQELSCWRSLGCSGLGLLTAILSISVLHFVLFYIYADPSGITPFRKYNRPGIWIFLLFSILFLLLFIYFLLRWKKSAKSWIKQKYTRTHNNRGNSNTKPRLIQFYKSIFHI